MERDYLIAKAGRVGTFVRSFKPKPKATKDAARANTNWRMEHDVSRQMFAKPSAGASLRGMGRQSNVPWKPGL